MWREAHHGGGHHEGGCDCQGGGHGEHHGHHEHGEECQGEQECECHDYAAEFMRYCGCLGGEHPYEIHFHRRFSTRAERITRFEEYLRDLQAEAKAVEEKIAEMKTASA